MVWAWFGLSALSVVLLNGWAWSRDRAGYGDAFGTSLMLFGIWAVSHSMVERFGFPEATRIYPLMDAVGSLFVLRSFRGGERAMWKGGVLACFVFMACTHVAFWLNPEADAWTYWLLGSFACAVQLLFAALPGGGRLVGSILSAVPVRLRRGVPSFRDRVDET